MTHIEVTATTSGSADAVFGLLKDALSWPSWSPMTNAVVERPGSDGEQGVGAIRRLTKGRTTGRDEVVDLVPGRRFSYVHLGPLPVRDYRADVDLDVSPAGTGIRWTATFRPKYLGTGWLIKPGIRKMLQQCADGLAAHAGSLGNAKMLHANGFDGQRLSDKSSL